MQAKRIVSEWPAYDLEIKELEEAVMQGIEIVESIQHPTEKHFKGYEVIDIQDSDNDMQDDFVANYKTTLRLFSEGLFFGEKDEL